MIDLAATLAAGGLALPDDRDAVRGVAVTGADPVLATGFPIGEAAAAALAAGGAAAARLHRLRGGEPQSVAVDVGAAAASLLGFALVSLDPPREELSLRRASRVTTALYACGDGRFIHLHGGFPHLHAGTLELLDCASDAGAPEIAAAVQRWRSFELEQALADAGLCGAVVRSELEWAAHPQGRALAPLAALELERIGDAPVQPLPAGDSPLAGVRVLDWTRVLAGPTVGRTLAQYGADVLRVAGPQLPSILPFVIETGHGKRACYLDLRCPDDAERFRALLRGADVFVDGYRNGSLARRGLANEQLAALRPGLVVVTVSCYGDVGPWAERRGWEQLAQSASGIAAAQGRDGPPRLLPAAATDYTTGYLGALGALEALCRRATEGGSWRVRVSLCQTAGWLLRLGTRCDPERASGLPDLAALRITSETPWGRLVHLAPAVRLSATPPCWRRPSVPLGHDAAVWLPRAG